MTDDNNFHPFTEPTSENDSRDQPIFDQPGSMDKAKFRLLMDKKRVEYCKNEGLEISNAGMAVMGIAILDGADAPLPCMLKEEVVAKTEDGDLACRVYPWKEGMDRMMYLQPKKTDLRCPETGGIFPLPFDLNKCEDMPDGGKCVRWSDIPGWGVCKPMAFPVYVYDEDMVEELS